MLKAEEENACSSNIHVTLAESNAALRTICEQDGLNMFLDSSFDADAYTATVIASHAVEDTLSRLVSGIKDLDLELHSQVVSRHEDLLQQASGIHKLENVLSTINTRVMALQSSIGRIMNRIDKPHRSMQRKLLQLERIQFACDILRRTIRFLYVLKRLKEQVLMGDHHMPKVAQSLADTEEVFSDGDGLTGVHVVDRERDWVDQQRKIVVSKADKLLSNGLVDQNQSDISTALQVFYNLGTLQTRTRSEIGTLSTKVKRSIRDTLATTALAGSTATQQSGIGQLPGSGGGGGGGNGSARTNTWKAIEKLYDIMFNSFLQVHLLVDILGKKRDAATFVYFIDTVRNDPKENIIKNFWASVTSSFEKEVSAQIRDSPSLAMFFESEVPRLVGLCNSLHLRMIALQPTQEDTLTAGLQRFENVYLSRSASRLADGVNMMFGGSAVPTRESVTSLCRSIASELQVTALNRKFVVSMSKKIIPIVKLFCRKCELLLGGNGSYLWQFQKIATANHIQQIEVINNLDLFITSLNTIISTKVPEGSDAQTLLTKALTESYTFLNELLSGLFSAASSHITSKIALIHSQDYTLEGVSGKGRQETSSYITEVAQTIKSLYSQYLSRLSLNLSTTWCLILCEKIAELFIRHVSLVRKLSDGGKLRLTGDMTAFELALSPLLERTDKRVSEIGSSYAQLRNIRATLFLETEKLDLASRVVQKSNPIVLLHHLFSRAPTTMPSPHTLMQCSVIQYAQWMDDRPDREILAVIQGSVDTYTNACMSRGDKEFAPVYPFMVALLRKVAVQHTE
eukprot:CFRG4589T1